MKKKLYCIGVGGIGVSALARYYLSEGWEVFGSDAHDSHIIEALKNEGCDIIIGNNSERINESIDLVIYTEAIPLSQSELQKSHTLSIKTLKYSDALGEVVNNYNLIAISGTHGKSTTTSMIAQILKNASLDFTAIIGTLLKEFNGKNFYSQGEKNYFVIESCEYKEHFLAYKPLVAVITNIEYDHADYFKTQESYTEAFKKYIHNIRTGGFCILNGDDTNCRQLLGLRNDIHYISVFQTHFIIHSPAGDENHSFPEIHLIVPGQHILFDAKLAYIVGHMLGINDSCLVESLEAYSGVWRRMEYIGKTEAGNILMSDYGHHPTEIQVTLKALREGYPDKKILCVFQAHQYSRTLELLEGFTQSFHYADTLIITNIYESRDSDEDKKKINVSALLEQIHHPRSYNGQGFEKSLQLIEEYEENNKNNTIILLLGAGDIDILRYKIKTS